MKPEYENNGSNKPAVLIIGIGNDFRCDDATGLAVARRLKTAAPGHVRVIEQSGEGTALMEAWRGAERVILIDAASSPAPAGTISRLDGRSQQLSAKQFHASSHIFGVFEAIEMANALDQLPEHLTIYAIEGKRFEMGDSLSPEVLNAVDETAEKILEELKLMTEIEG